MVPFLTRELVFPPVNAATDDGLVAVGGDLSVARLLLAYSTGIFPWPVYEDLLTWFSPDPRAIIELDGLHISRSLRKTMRRGLLEVRVNTAFSDVMQKCAEATPGRPSTWIIPQMFPAYQKLHELGYAHSVETWAEDELVGGIYGVSIGGLFSGESMFARQTDASKIAMVALVERMKSRGLSLFDVQVMNPHLERMGAIEISRDEYVRRLAVARVDKVWFGDVPPTPQYIPTREE